MRQPRFEVVRSDAGWFARFIAANGQTVWVTEVYTTRRRALGAIRILVRPLDAALTSVGVRCIAYHEHTPIEVREVDERSPR